MAIGQVALAAVAIAALPVAIKTITKSPAAKQGAAKAAGNAASGPASQATRSNASSRSSTNTKQGTSAPKQTVLQNMASVRQQIPSDWISKPSDKSGGTIYSNPKNPGHDYVRVMPGDPASPYKSQHNPYVVRQKNGTFRDKDDNVVDRKSAESHIPIDDFKFRP